MIGDITFTPGSDADARRGLLAYVRIEYGGLVLDGITLRRTTDGRLTLSWPARRDRQGRDHPYARPLTDAVRREVEEAVVAALRRQETAP